MWPREIVYDPIFGESRLLYVHDAYSSDAAHVLACRAGKLSQSRAVPLRFGRTLCPRALFHVVGDLVELPWVLRWPIEPVCEGADDSSSAPTKPKSRLTTLLEGPVRSSVCDALFQESVVVILL